METQEMVVSQQDNSFPMAFADAQAQFENLKKFVSSQLKKDVDYGRTPGQKKPALWKPGAEKLRFFNRLGVRFEPTLSTRLDWDKDFFNYEYKAIASSLTSGLVVAEAFGSCNSYEDAFQKTINTRGVRAADLANNISKRAQKRAFVAVILMATQASFYFTQDLDEKEEPVGSSNSKPAQAVAPVVRPTGDVISEKQSKWAHSLIDSSSLSHNEIKAVAMEDMPYAFDEAGFHVDRILKKDFEKFLKFLQANTTLANA